MEKPVIGITTNSLFSESGSFPGMERVYVNQTYVYSVLKAGAVPVLLPSVVDERSLAEQLKRIDALLLSGGGDINPLLFGEEPDQKLGCVLADRDEYEIRLIQLAHTQGIPVLGICRGIQIINVAFGGSIFQDIYSQAPGCRLKHSQDSRSDFASHTVDIVSGSQLYEILGKTALPVNSYHHQSVKTVAPGFVINARSRDLIIEGIEKTSGSFLLGVQWHPEMLVDSYPIMLNLFTRLAKEASKRMLEG